MKQSIFICLALVVIVLSGCGSMNYHNKKADDSISKAIYEAVGEDVYYYGQEYESEEELNYTYLIWEEREDLLQDVVSAVNETIEKEKVTNNVAVFFKYELPGGMGSLASLRNYSDNELITPDCDGLQRLIITGNKDEYSGDYYNNPNSYITIPNIKYLSVCGDIHERAVAEGIDWWEIWPELESVEVFSYIGDKDNNLMPNDVISSVINEELGGSVFCRTWSNYSDEHLSYEYLIREENSELFCNLVSVVNETIETECIEQKIDIYLLYCEDSGSGYEPFVCLSNYSESDLTAPDYTGLQRLEIMGKGGEDNSTYLYNDPSVYTQIPDIKCLKVTNLIKERAEAEGIDWYDYWPELESVEIFE